MRRTEGLTFLSEFRTLAKDTKHLKNMNIIEHKVEESKQQECSARVDSELVVPK